MFGLLLRGLSRWFQTEKAKERPSPAGAAANVTSAEGKCWNFNTSPLAPYLLHLFGVPSSMPRSLAEPWSVAKCIAMVICGFPFTLCRHFRWDCGERKYSIGCLGAVRLGVTTAFTFVSLNIAACRGFRLILSSRMKGAFKNKLLTNDTMHRPIKPPSHLSCVFPLLGSWGMHFHCSMLK